MLSANLTDSLTIRGSLWDDWHIAPLQDGRIRRMGDTECWFCASLENTLSLMEKTVMKEGCPYYKVGGAIGHYPKFEPEDYEIIELALY